MRRNEGRIAVDRNGVAEDRRRSAASEAVSLKSSFSGRHVEQVGRAGVDARIVVAVCPDNGNIAVDIATAWPRASHLAERVGGGENGSPGQAGPAEDGGIANKPSRNDHQRKEY